MASAVHRRRSSSHTARPSPLGVSSITAESSSPESSPIASTPIDHDPSSLTPTPKHSRKAGNVLARLRLWWSVVARASLWEWVRVALLIFGGCCSNVLILEGIIREVPDSMSLVTLFQFLFVSMEGLYFGGFLIVRPRDTSTHPSLRGYIPKEALGKQSLIHWLVPFEVELKPRVIPLYQWFVTVLMFWTVSIMTNAALSYKVDMPLHILFKSGGLLVNMVAGYLWLGKRYTSDQLFSVCLVTVGVLTSTYTTASNVQHGTAVAAPLSEWLIGIGLLTASILLSTILGLYQETIYKKYGRQWREGLFYTHFLALPFFLLMSSDLWRQVRAINATPLVTVADVVQYVPVLSYLTPLFPDIVGVPRQWLYLFANSIAQYLCIRGVYQLTSLSTSLTVNLVLTFRKFISLLLSIYLFSNRFERGHFIGTLLVFLGTFWYSFATSMTPPTRPRSASVGSRSPGSGRGTSPSSSSSSGGSPVKSGGRTKRSKAK